MKRVLTILTVLLFVYIQMFNAGVWINYEINKSEIIKQFCENKDKPELKCDGKCHMKKMMMDEGGEKGDDIITTLPEIQLFFDCFAIDIHQIETIDDRTTVYSDLYSFRFLDDIDIPPRA